jgi:tryptophanyl-tRNA synthetase
MTTSLTGVKPTHLPHIGNLLGAIQPALRLAEEHDRSFYFIADYHALTTVRDPERLREHTRDVTASWLAAGLDPERSFVYRQSDVPEVFELAWAFACLLATGQLERGHAYKDAVAKGDNPNAGILFYPVLMAADIVLFDADVVPVGQDQAQHVELARDVATRFNHAFGETLVVPQVSLTEAKVVPGLDGAKMSKSRDNTIPVMASAKEIRKACMRIVTSSEGLDEPKDPASSTVFQLYSLIASPDATASMAERLVAGGYGWGHAKQALAEEVEALVAPIRSRYEQLREDPAELDAILVAGAERVRPIAHETMRRVRSAIGIT